MPRGLVPDEGFAPNVGLVKDYTPQIDAEMARLVALTGDPSVPVPTCPGWTLADLVTHVGRIQRWATHVLREQVQERVWPPQVPSGLPEGAKGDTAWLRAGAAALLDTLRGTDPALPVWTWGPDRRASWWAPRMLFELMIHRADAELALGIEPEIPASTAAAGIEEYLTNLPYAGWVTRRLATLDAEGATIHLHATDGDGEWTVTQGPAGRFTWERGHAKGDVAVRGPLADLLLVLYGRRSSDAVEVFGDRDFLDRWLSTAAL
ncbi:TIGR03083 family protein [Nonomuraea maritima]|uniref:TIGR03083 family protein n=1 Tax=Nonomuraea maritima TaxID=683260 RepID=A0A1G9NIP2_9ACTN|nr:TIGR03083 family protein [Nonomuraea maritima]